MSARILFVENDYNVAAITGKRLPEHGYEVELAFDGAAGLELFKKGKFDICLLDIVMPKLNGFQLAQKIRQINDFVPILFLTSRSMQDDKIAGFKTGADDYVTKPFSVQELLLRIQVFLKRSERTSAQAAYTIGTYMLDMERFVLYREGKNVGLSMQEVKVLLILAKNRKNIISRTHLIQEIWGKEEDHFLERSLDVLIHRLRKRLKDDPHVEIETVRKAGYRLEVYDGI